MGAVNVETLSRLLGEVAAFAGRLEDQQPAKFLTEECRDFTDLLEIGQKAVDIKNLCLKDCKVVVMGMGNVGKSSIINTILGEKDKKGRTTNFWPVSSDCMTSCICETRHGTTRELESQDGSRLPLGAEGKVPRDAVNKSARLEREEFADLVKRIARAWMPSAFLQPGVALVDMPGLDQETAYIPVMKQYMKETSAENVVLVYVVDVNHKLRNPDRKFLQELHDSSWSRLRHDMILLVNIVKWDDGDDGDDSDEHLPDYERLIQDIQMEAANYCRGCLLRLSVKDLKKKCPCPQAMEQWEAVKVALHESLCAKKLSGLLRSLDAIHPILNSLKTAVADAEDRSAAIKQKADVLQEARGAVDQFRTDQDRMISRRASEMKEALRERRKEHREAIARIEVPHKDLIVKLLSNEKVKEIDEEVCKKLASMVQLDVEISRCRSDAFNGMGSSLVEAQRVLNAIIEFDKWAASVVIATGMVPHFIMGALVPSFFVVTLLSLGAFCAFQGSIVRVDSEYVKARFDVIYDKLMEEKSLQDIAEKEFHARVRGLKQALQDQERTLRNLEEAAWRKLVQPEYSVVLQALSDDFAKLVEKCRYYLVGAGI